jgi:hypothetical protein
MPKDWCLGNTHHFAHEFWANAENEENTKKRKKSHFFLMLMFHHHLHVRQVILFDEFEEFNLIYFLLMVKFI